MIKRAGDLKIDIVTNRFGGQGDVKMTQILEKEEFYGKGRLFARNAIEPGCSLGLHQHKGDMEAYYIISGQGTVDDNGQEVVVGPGDVVFTKDGESHSIANNGTTTLEFIALILFTT